MPKKHNKKRNTAFLYEVLCRELTKCLMEGDEKRAKTTKNILKKYFSGGSILSEELQIYQDLYEAHDMPQRVAEKTLNEAKRVYTMFNRDDVYKHQSALIDDINQDLGKSTYKNFVPNYKSLATIDQIFKNADLKPREKVLFEERIMHEMRSPEKKEEEKKEPIDSLVFENFVEKFNEKYGKELIEEQKELLQKYMMSRFDNMDIDFRSYLEDEVGRLKEELKRLTVQSEDARKDDQLREKLNKTRDALKDFSGKNKLDEQDLEDIMRVQQVISDLEKDDE